MRVLTLAASVGFPILMLGLGRLGTSYGPVEALALVILFVLPVLIGRLGGWWAVPIFAAACAIDVVLYQLLFWTDDPKLTGTDDLPPSIIIVGLPFLLLLVGLGAVLRPRTRERASRR
jgi:hypothetical protein